MKEAIVVGETLGNRDLLIDIARFYGPVLVFSGHVIKRFIAT
jgi:hypothetical protein